MVLSHRNFEKISLTFLKSSLLFKNEAGILNYKIENSGLKDSFMIQVNSKIVEHLLPQDSKEMQIDFTPVHYGIQNVPLQRFESRFPLQFLVVWRFFQPSLKITVFPEKINYLDPSRQESETQAGGLSIQPEESLEKEFSHFDRFQQTDSIQHINWKIFSKTNQLFITKFENKGDEEQHIVLRWSETEVLNDIEKRKSQFSYWIDDLFKEKKKFLVEYENQQITVNINDHKSLVKALRLLL